MDKLFKSLEASGVNVIRMPSQWFQMGGYAWNTGRADKQIVGIRYAAGHPPDLVVDPFDWIAGIVHDPLFGPDPDPRDIPRPAHMPDDFKIEIDKHAALRLEPAACDRPGIAVHAPGEEPGAVWIIDGWKRMYRAYTLGRHAFGLYFLPPFVEAAIRIDPADAAKWAY